MKKSQEAINDKRRHKTLTGDLVLETVDGDRGLSTLNSNAQLGPEAVTQKGEAAGANCSGESGALAWPGWARLLRECADGEGAGGLHKLAESMDVTRIC
jgi:hypothetical protein